MSANVSIIIVTYNSAADIAECVAPLVGGTGLEVLVVDNASTDESATMAEQMGCRVLRQTSNAGWTSACNLGARTAQGEVLIFLNPDARLSLPVADRLAGLAREARGPVAPRFTDDHGKTQPMYQRFPTVLTGLFLYTAVGQQLDRRLRLGVLRRHVYDFEPGAEIDHAAAACLAIAADLFWEYQGFDESMWLFFSDQDLSRRMAQGGDRLTVAWEHEVVHAGQGSVRHLRADALLELVQRDYLRYSRRAYSPLGYATTWIGSLFLSALLPLLIRGLRADWTGARRSILAVRRTFRT